MLLANKDKTLDEILKLKDEPDCTEESKETKEPKKFIDKKFGAHLSSFVLRKNSEMHKNGG